MDGTSIFLRDFVNREIRHVDIRTEPGLEWSPDVAKLFPDYPLEEGVALNLISTSMLATFATDAMFRVAQESASLG